MANPGTAVGQLGPEPAVDAEAVARLYALAQRDLGGRPWSFPGDPGYRVFVQGGAEKRALDLRLHRRAYAIVGRHKRADLRLGYDGISLRHLLLRTIRLANGDLALRVLDLRSSLPFYVGAQQDALRSIVATGPVGFRLGPYALCAIPHVTDQSGELVKAPPELPAPRISDGSAVPRGASFDDARWNTDITRLPEVSEVSEMSSLDPGSSSKPRSYLTVERDGLAATVGLESEQLQQGILVGRASRCLDGGVREILSAEISRAHLLLLEEGERVRIFDLASTNGTHVDGSRVRSMSISSRGTVRLSRSGGVTVRFSPHRPPDPSP